jgi:hypothetical protein
VLGIAAKIDGRLPLRVDAVEKGFLVPERRRAFQKRALSENIDSSILDFGVYDYPFPRVECSVVDFFNSIGQLRGLDTFRACPVSA